VQDRQDVFVVVINYTNYVAGGLTSYKYADICESTPSQPESCLKLLTLNFPSCNKIGTIIPQEDLVLQKEAISAPGQGHFHIYYLDKCF
jgi:hypothetical protein